MGRSTHRLALLVHGGAWAIPQQNTAATLAGIRAAALRGWGVLESGSAVDAVEAAVRVLEDDPVFDAGRGSVLTEEGQVEMDAVIMDGRTLETGAGAFDGSICSSVTTCRRLMTGLAHDSRMHHGCTQPCLSGSGSDGTD